MLPLQCVSDLSLYRGQHHAASDAAATVLERPLSIVDSTMYGMCGAVCKDTMYGVCIAMGHVCI